MDRPPGLEQDPNYEALTLLTSLPLALWMARYEASTVYRRAGACSAGLLAAAVIITQSRAAIIALGAMTIAAVYYSRRKTRTMMMLALATILLLPLAPAGLTQRFHSVKLSGDAPQWRRGVDSCAS